MNSLTQADRRVESYLVTRTKFVQSLIRRLPPQAGQASIIPGPVLGGHVTETHRTLPGKYEGGMLPGRGYTRRKPDAADGCPASFAVSLNSQPDCALDTLKGSAEP